MPQVVPYGKGPIVAKQRRGDPTPAEMQLLAQCVRGQGFVELEHARGEERPAIVQLAFELQERGWLAPPGEPHIVERNRRGLASLPSEQEVAMTEEKVMVRVWRFPISEKGRQAYRVQMDRFGVKA